MNHLLTPCLGFVSTTSNLEGGLQTNKSNDWNLEFEYCNALTQLLGINLE
jgi:hypothetical protein